MTIRLESIGFYTLTDERARHTSSHAPLARCELVLTARCNFKCPYCRGVGGEDTKFEDAEHVVRLWAKDGLQAIRFSGGEPTLWKGLPELCALSRDLGIGRIAVSTNGSADREAYERLLDCGANDFSVSLDACCAEDAAKMSGGVREAFDAVTGNIAFLSARTYTTVGVVLTDTNAHSLGRIIETAKRLGVSDIRLIPAAQNSDLHIRLSDVPFDPQYPILHYRISNLRAGRIVRGVPVNGPKKCSLVLDDIAVCQGKHYPCIIYMRESGQAIGDVGPDMRWERLSWHERHDPHTDPICRANCIDVCVDYNAKVEELQGECK